MRALPELLTRAEVAAMFRVSPATVRRWAAAGWAPTVRLPGGHLRFKTAVVLDLLSGGES